MEITNSLILKFFANQCDPQEFEAVMQFFELHPDLAAKVMGLEEWEATDPTSLTPDDQQAEVLLQLRQRIFPKPEPIGLSKVTVPGIRRFAWTAIAASFLLAVGGWVFIINKNTSGKSIAAASSPAKELPVQAIWKTQTNSTARILSFELPDGSRVKLHGHSSVRYIDSFGLYRRNLWLAGEAEFAVKKDKAHPFTVYSSSLATTALGTLFGVKTGTGGEAVKLYSGRVVVRSMRPGLKGWSKDVYLAPGQQVSYDNRQALATVSRFNPLPGDGSSKPAGPMQQDLVFNNSPLKQVFDQLTFQYQTKITYRAQDVVGLNFTGTVPRTDSLAAFLRLLGTMNNLDIQEQEAGFIVAKQKK